MNSVLPDMHVRKGATKLRQLDNNKSGWRGYRPNRIPEAKPPPFQKYWELFAVFI